MASRKVGHWSTIAVGALLVLGITVFVNKIVSDLRLGRFDLTEDRVYTVSEGAKNIIATLEVPVQVKFYVTPKDAMPSGLKTLQQEVTDKLDELSIASDGYLEYQVVDPTESEELEDALIQKGVRPFQVQSVDRDEIAVKRVYSSITIGYKDKPDEIMPQVLPETLNNFEYELLSKVLKIVREKQPVVAVYSTREPIDPEMARFYLQMQQPLPEPQDNFTLVPQLLQGQGYDVRPVELTEGSTIPEDAQTLIVLAPRDLDERQRYEITRFLRGGGNVIVAAQALVYDYNAGPRGGFSISVRPQPLDVNDLLTEFGVRIDDRMLMDEQMATLAIPREQNIGGLRVQMTEPVQAPMQIRVLGDGVNHDIPLTAGVPEVLFLWGTQLIVDDEALVATELTVTPVFRASSQSWLVDKQSGPLTQEDIEPEGHDGLDRPLLAALIEGQFPDPWDGEEIPEWPGGEDHSAAEEDNGDDTDEGDDDDADEDNEAEAPIEPAPGRLLVVGCSKLVEDMLLEQQAHALFVLNSVDALSLGDDLISIRSKVYERRTVGEVTDEKKLAFRLANMALIPALVIVLGLARLIHRRREEAEYAIRTSGSGGGKA